MEQFNDISKHVEKAQGDKARFLKSKEGLLPHFEFPNQEAQHEKQFSKETLLADIYEEKIDQMKKIMESPILLKSACEDLVYCSEKGREGGCESFALDALCTYSAILNSGFFFHFSPEKQEEIKFNIHDSDFIENSYKNFTEEIKWGRKGGSGDASYALWTYSAFTTSDLFPYLSQEKRREMESAIFDPLIIEASYKYFLSDIQALEVGGDVFGSDAFRACASFITSDVFTRLSEEKCEKIESTISNPIFIEIPYQYFLFNTGVKDSRDSASYAFRTLSSLITVKDYLREKGKKIDDETFANEALNPTEKIPPRPETRNNY